MPLPNTHSQDKASNIIDLIKLICCILIIGNHTRTIFNISTMDYYYREWFFRFCVPFFFIATGYFTSNMDQKKRILYIRRIAVLYLISSLIYIPLYINEGALYILFYLFFAYYHLWYLSALVLSLLILEVANTRIGNKKYILFLLLPIAIFLDEYYKLFNCNSVEGIAFTLENTGIITILRAIPFLLIGDYINTKKISAPVKYCVPAFLLLMIISFLESRLLLSHLNTDITLDASIFGWMPAVPLFLSGIRTPSFLSTKTTRSLRKVVDIVYIIHIWMLYISEKLFGLLYFPKFISAVLLSFVLAVIILFISQTARKLRLN